MRERDAQPLLAGLNKLHESKGMSQSQILQKKIVVSRLYWLLYDLRGKRTK